MLVEDFLNNCREYTNFQIMEVESMEAFFSLSDVMPQVFEHLYGMPLSSFVERRKEIPATEMKIMEKILDHIGDRYFFIFTWHSDHHAILVQLQDSGVMNFGMDINDIQKENVYICMMEKPGAANAPS